MASRHSSENQFIAHMSRLETEPIIKAVGVRTRFISGQLDK